VQALLLDRAIRAGAVEIVGAVNEVLMQPEIGQHVVQPQPA
jgi:hypothetical protein